MITTQEPAYGSTDAAHDRDPNGFDADGVGQVRVRKKQSPSFSAKDQSAANYTPTNDAPTNVSDTVSPDTQAPPTQAHPKQTSSTTQTRSLRNGTTASSSHEPKLSDSTSAIVAHKPINGLSERQTQELAGDQVAVPANQPVTQDNEENLAKMNDSQLELSFDNYQAAVASPMSSSDSDLDYAEHSPAAVNSDDGSGFDAPAEHENHSHNSASNTLKGTDERGPQTQDLSQAPSLCDKSPEKQNPVEPQQEEPSEVLMLYLMAHEGQELSGAELLSCLLSLNLKFGDMDIFHRHEDNAGTGRVVFSLANMVKPGTFDPDNMEQFNTQGVVVFMTIPCPGDALMNFSLMLNSVHQLADDLGARVLDGQRNSWSDTAKQDYLRRIRAIKK